MTRACKNCDFCQYNSLKRDASLFCKKNPKYIPIKINDACAYGLSDNPLINGLIGKKIRSVEDFSGHNNSHICLHFSDGSSLSICAEGDECAHLEFDDKWGE